MIVTIDGPAGAGKSTVARALAERLGFRFLDTGAMYRTVTLAALRENLIEQEPDALVKLAERLRIELVGNQVLLNGEDVSSAIRTVEVTEATKHAANNPGVRAILVEQQKRLGSAGNIVTEGRDQGTVVFPQAECKIFLTASPEERARRRVADLRARGEAISLSDVLSQQTERDCRDTSRSVGPLQAAADAREILTDGMDQRQVIDRLEQLVRARQAELGRSE